MKSFLLFIKWIFYKIGIDISFVQKEETRSAIELNRVETVNKGWSEKKMIDKSFAKPVLARYAETLAILDGHGIKLSEKSVIDVGCGNGMLLKYFHDNCNISSQTGMEYAEAAIEVAKKVNPAASYIVHDITKPYIGRYDTVFCTEVLEHILYPANTFKNLLDMVVDGGILFVTVPNGRGDTFSGHINFWSPESWEVFIAENSDGLSFSTGESGKNLLYGIVRK